MRIFLSILLITCLSFDSFPQHISQQTAHKAACSWIENHYGYKINRSDVLLDNEGEILGYQFDLSPSGYLVFSADKSLPPVIAYSLTSAFSSKNEGYNPLREILIRDIGNRLDNLSMLTEETRLQNHSRWDIVLGQGSGDRSFRQWPPEGSTSTGGWLETNWSQSNPYNKFCPMDNVNNARSVAGCPAVALSMILHYQKNLNGTQLNNADDYYHSYAGRQYWIDDDAHGWDFPSFPELNNYFDSIAIKYTSYISLNEDEIAALVFASGVAAQQVYTSEVSGTFGVEQAYDAYLRFGYHDAILIYDSDTSFYTRMRNNIKDSRPVHLAVLSSTGQGGHNLVADGYNTDDYFHLNFGWGGNYNGWYLLPDEIPYNLTIIEGAVVDIGIAHVEIDEPNAHHDCVFNMYPNPVEDIMYLKCPDLLSQPGLIEIFSIDGKGLVVKHFNQESGKAEIDMSGLTTGMYICRITAGNFHSAKKIVKK